jgi:DNA repair protein RadA/Sms
MAKIKTIYTCSFCGTQSPKWLGKCPDCDQWNTFYEEKQSATQNGSRSASGAVPLALHTIAAQQDDRTPTGISELDRVLGGGLVPGAVILIGGDPGIGKSTLVLQALTKLSEAGRKVLYVTGEESARQIRMRAERLGRLPENVLILAETSLEHINSHISECKPSVLVIDSVQTVYSPELESAPGSVSQLRETSSRLIQHAKRTDTATFLIGHVTKDGAIAGPRVLEHMVDTVLYFEGDRGHSYRILRAVKNRFGSTDEIGVFEMSSTGLVEVTSPSELFISERSNQSPGSAVVPSMEGTRPILIEIQALVAPTPLSMPRRTAIGIDQNKTSLLIAVLEKKIGVKLFNQDVFINVAGGIRVNEPAVDLGIVAAIISSRLDQQVPADMVMCGEVGLTGEVRAISQVSTRINEAARLGFKRCLVPEASRKNITGKHAIECISVSSVQNMVDYIFKLR